jgi:dTDP-4-dehydrorhamnose 3,5-epimerase
MKNGRSIMGGSMIEGVKTKRLRIIPDERGRLMEILRADDELFQQFTSPC